MRIQGETGKGEADEPAQPIPMDTPRSFLPEFPRAFLNEGAKKPGDHCGGMNK
jgi:hypothetical protein